MSTPIKKIPLSHIEDVNLNTEIPNWDNNSTPYSNKFIVAHNGGIWRGEIDSNNEEPTQCENTVPLYEELTPFTVDRNIVNTNGSEQYDFSNKILYDGVAIDYWTGRSSDPVGIAVSVGDIVSYTLAGGFAVIGRVLLEITGTETFSEIQNNHLDVEYITIPFNNEMLTEIPCDSMLLNALSNQIGLDVPFIKSTETTIEQVIDCVLDCPWTLLAQVNESSGGGSIETSIETSDSETIAFSGNGTTDNPLSAEVLGGSSGSTPDLNTVMTVGNSAVSQKLYLDSNNSDGPFFYTNDSSVGIGKFSDTAGPSNTILSNLAGVNMNGAYNNVIIGFASAHAITSGHSNTVIGPVVDFLGELKTGSQNILVGSQPSVGNGSLNIAIGTQAYANNDTSIAIGTSSRSSTNSIVLGKASGSYSLVGGSNIGRQHCIVIGNNHNTTKASPFITKDSELVINSYANASDKSIPLIKGDFTTGAKYLTIGGRLTVSPEYLETADLTYTKNIVAKPDGTFGWEDRISVPKPPTTGTVTLQSVNGVLTWI